MTYANKFAKNLLNPLNLWDFFVSISSVVHFVPVFERFFLFYWIFHSQNLHIPNIFCTFALKFRPRKGDAPMSEPTRSLRILDHTYY